MQGEIDPLPDFPEPLRHVWWCFSQLAGTRQPAQVIAPITFAEIAEFNRSTLAGLTASEVLLIHRVDERVRAVSLGVYDPTPKTQRRGIGSFLKAKAAESRKRREKANG